MILVEIVLIYLAVSKHFRNLEQNEPKIVPLIHFCMYLQFMCTVIWALADFPTPLFAVHMYIPASVLPTFSSSSDNPSTLV